MKTTNKIVVIGGGTGLSVLLRGIKKITSDVTAVVSVADDGGGSGVLREDLGMLPPGDIRSCILALANKEPILQELFQYRFEEGKLKGQNLGNLVIAGMIGISDSFEDAIKKTSDIFAITGKVLPVTLDDVELCAELENGTIVIGESDIPYYSVKKKSPIKRVYLEPEKVRLFSEVAHEITNADIIIIGPGSLYTSIIPNLLIQELPKAIALSNAKVIYISNLMTQLGETDNYSFINHVDSLEMYLGKNVLDEVYFNIGNIPDEIRKKYSFENACQITSSDEETRIIESRNIKVIKDNFVEIKKGYLRHDYDKLAEKIRDGYEKIWNK